MNHYPQSPGWKEPDTSQSAAVDMEPKAELLRQRCLEALHSHSMSADEVAESIGESVLSVRPRITELLKLGRIEDTGVRHANLSGRLAKVWRPVTLWKQEQLI